MSLLNQVSASAAPDSLAARGRILVDQTHCGREVTGIERIALELFSPTALAPLPLVPVRAGGRLGMVMGQTFGLPLSLARHPRDIVLCPGFPPSFALTLFGGRVLPYIHDVFLLTRPADLNPRAKLYMREPFRFAVARLPRFLVNSEHTRDALRPFCRPDARVTLYRPAIRNVFGLSTQGRAERTLERRHLRLVALGTVEPRKNLPAAAAILTALRARGFPHATLDVVGRLGWGQDAAALARVPGVVLHGYQPVDKVRHTVEAADVLISTAHDEGLGLPLLEAQYAGLAVATPGSPVFAEVLGASGIRIRPDDAGGAATRLAALVREPGWRARHAVAGLANLRRWNAAAERDRGQVIELVGALVAGRTG